MTQKKKQLCSYSLFLLFFPFFAEHFLFAKFQDPILCEKHSMITIINESCCLLFKLLYLKIILNVFKPFFLMFPHLKHVVVLLSILKASFPQTAFYYVTPLSVADQFVTVIKRVNIIVVPLNYSHPWLGAPSNTQFSCTDHACIG